jgi:hypothetical protein
VVDAFGQSHGIVREVNSDKWYTRGGLDIVEQKLKPEGISLEVVDCVIRLLDWAGWKSYDLSMGVPRVNEMLAEDFKTLQPVEFCFLMAKKIIDIHGAALDDAKLNPSEQILLLVESCNNYISSRGYDMMDLIMIKHRYNVTRQPRHGGKVI